MATETTRDNKAIEEKALLCFKGYIVDSKVISQFLDENDKEPCWDGHLYLYSDPVKDKIHLIGRIPVQVKGTEVSRFVLKKYKFTIEMDDLKAYLNEPTVFVVCQEKKDSKERELFYRCLLPETVKNIIKGKEKQKTVNVLMHRIPENLIDFEDLMQVFYGDRKKQLSFTDKKPFTIDDVQKRGINEFSFFAPTHSIDRMELMKYLSTHPSYIYAKVDKELDFRSSCVGWSYDFLISPGCKERGISR